MFYHFLADFSIAPQVTELVTATRDSCFVQLPVSTASQIKTTSTAQNSVYLSLSSSSPALISYASYLRGLYTSMSHSHTSQHWTHLPRCEFIQLAMIGSGELRRGDREEDWHSWGE